METTDKISRQLLLWILIWFSVLGVALACFEYWEMGILKGNLYEYREQIIKGQSFEGIEQILRSIGLIYWQVLAGSLMVIGFFLWLTQRSSVMGVIKKYGVAGPYPPKPKPKKKREVPIDDQRRALHLLSLLQREGRLVDFLGEDLKDYDDAQIGAAVRNIQENCQKTLNKYLAPEAVIDQNEGDNVTINPGFDASAIKLTGDVAGEPPFKGILQHKGWRASAFNLPILSGSEDPGIIAPAEVEIPLD
ncbi:MAG: DUF2760 domain-containing protein [Desulfobacteraceae bacterium]|nr:DUF2760 domain-containing protein [Desulfobacteraceae bacterium]